MSDKETVSEREAGLIEAEMKPFEGQTIDELKFTKGKMHKKSEMYANRLIQAKNDMEMFEYVYQKRLGKADGTPAKLEKPRSPAKENKLLAEKAAMYPQLSEEDLDDEIQKMQKKITKLEESVADINYQKNLVEYIIGIAEAKDTE